MKTMLILFVLLLAGCSDPTPKENDRLKSDTQTGRIHVVSAQRIRCSEYKYRDILVLRDTTTGKEYLAVMGAGVTDMHMQSNGKMAHEVEE